MSKAFEVNFDGLVGPTHNYAGLSFGNIASLTNKASQSNPKEAALQGLKKMKYLSHLGLKQALLPPQQRPDLDLLRRLGLSGSDEKVLTQTRKEMPSVFSAIWSSSSMWTANAATIAPSADTADHKVHFTAANLISKLHRTLEPKLTSKVLKKIFSDSQYFSHHDPLPDHLDFGDEGAANHTRFCPQYGHPGVHFFVYGRKCFIESEADLRLPHKFPARQTYEASLSIARLHQLASDQVVYAQQTPEAIDAGVFHNDVVAVGNLNTLFYHEEAYVNSKRVIDELQEKYQRISGQDLQIIEVKSNDLELTDAVKTYLFNSQLIGIPHQENEMALIAPIECQENPRVKQYLDHLIQNLKQPIRQVHYVDIRQSMRNGGGPACLRLRVVLNEEEIQKALPSVFLSESLYQRLVQWVEKHYRDQLTLADLTDPSLIRENYEALDQLTQILNLGSVYPFQQSFSDT